MKKRKKEKKALIISARLERGREGDKGQGTRARYSLAGTHTLLLNGERSSIYHSVRAAPCHFGPYDVVGYHLAFFAPNPPCCFSQELRYFGYVLLVLYVVAFRRRDKVHQYICYERGKFSVLYLPLKPKIVMRNTCPVQGQREAIRAPMRTCSTYLDKSR